MKKILILIFVLSGIVLNVKAQNVGKINLGVVVPEQIEGLEASQIGKLKTKIEQICVKNGISTGYTSNGFVIYPVFEIYDSEIVEGGMQQIYSVKVDLTLFIKQINGISISSATTKLSGSGNSKNKAIVNAIDKITSNDPVFKRLIFYGKEEIIEYYKSNCEIIIQQAKSMSNKGQYKDAIALLLSVPEEITCYQEVLDLSDKIYNLYLANHCNEIIKQIQAAKATGNYKKAASLISLINSKSSCYNQIPSLIAEIESKLSEEEKREWDFKMQQYKDSVKLKEQVIEAAKEVAKTYYSNQPPVTYIQLFK